MKKNATHKPPPMASREWLAKEQLAAKDAFLASNDIRALLARQTALCDTVLAALYEKAAPGGGAGVALVATGGYGRRELFPYSDIDIVFLYHPDCDKHAASIAETVLYALWDLGLKVGQAHRTPDEAMAAAQMDVTIRTALLDARCIAGDHALFDGFFTRFNAELVEGKEREFIEAKLVERDARHHRFGDSRYMLEPNVKEGKGGLRDVHTLWWLARAAYPIKNLSELVEKKLVSRDEYKAFEQARIFLCSVRAHLHYVAGRAEERLTFDYQHALALAMGFKNPSVNKAIERFMKRYFAAVRTVGNTTRIFCALLEDEKKRKPRGSFMRLWQMPWSLSGFVVEGHRVNVRHDEAFIDNPLMMIELFRIAQLHDLDVHPHALKLIARHLDLIDEELRNDPQANALLLDIMLYHKNAEATLRRMSEAGVLGAFIPEFSRIIGLSQFDMYHVYTVDEHTLVAVGMLHAMEKGSMKDELPMASDVIQRIRLKRVLYMAMLCHDIAKGRGGNHPMLGEKIASQLAARFGFSDDECDTVGWLVKHHLLFSNTAYKRDLADPKTVQDFVAAVQSPERLKLLFVLTVADIRAVSPHVWNAWKGVLLRELYNRAEQAMGTGKVEIKEQQVSWLRQDLLKSLQGWNDEELDHYLAQGEASFWASASPGRHAVVARMVRAVECDEKPLVLDTQHDHAQAITELTVCTRDQPALFANIAGAVSLAGANIINAKIFTLKNGIAVEIFQLQDLAGEVFDRPDRLAKMSVYIEQVLAGELDIESEFRKRKTPYLQARKNALPMPGQVLVDNEASNIHSVIELTGRDRAGLLHEVTHAIAELGLSIVTAHISTYGTQVADVFYVKDNFGMKITHSGKLKQMRVTLMDVVGG